MSGAQDADSSCAAVRLFSRRAAVYKYR